MKTTTRYIFTEILTPFLVATTVLGAISASYLTASSLLDPSNASLQPHLIAYLVFVRLMTVLDVIIPTALFFAVVFAVGRLYRDAEVTALLASGFSEWQLMRVVLAFAVFVSLIASVASNVGRPWAFRVSYSIQERACAELDVDDIRAGQLTELRDGGQTLLASSVDLTNRRLGDVVLQADTGNGRSRVVTAHVLDPPLLTNRRATFEDGSVYWLDPRGVSDRTLEFKLLTVPLGGPVAPHYRRKAADTYHLSRARSPAEVAEFQWRLAIPTTAIALAMLAVPLSHRTRRPGTDTRALFATMVYSALFCIFAITNDLVEKGRLPPLPGTWVFLFPALALLPLLARSSDKSPG